MGSHHSKYKTSLVIDDETVHKLCASTQGRLNMQEVKMLYYWFLDFINPIAKPPTQEVPYKEHHQVLAPVPQVLVPIRTSCTHEEFIRMLPDVGSDFVKKVCYDVYTATTGFINEEVLQYFGSQVSPSILASSLFKFASKEENSAYTSKASAGNLSAAVICDEDLIMKILFKDFPHELTKEEFCTYVETTLVQKQYKNNQMKFPIFSMFGVIPFIKKTFVTPILKKICSDRLSPPSYEGYVTMTKWSESQHWGTRRRHMMLCEMKHSFLFLYKINPQRRSEGIHTLKKRKANHVIPLARSEMAVWYYDSCVLSITPGTKFKRTFLFHDVGNLMEMMYKITANTPVITDHRFLAIAAPREGITTQWFVDGRDYFEHVSAAIYYAAHEIFIAGWWVTPELHLRRRNSQEMEEFRLDKLLLFKASQGVKVHVIIWNETTVAFELNSAHSKRTLEKLHPNILVLRHPVLSPLLWSHHQKMVIVDQDIAYVGGIDLCFGRYDTLDHPLTDPEAAVWPGKDYFNESIRTLTDADKAFDDMLDRNTTPRQPWHDIQMCCDGMAARDVARTFIQRWNHHLNDLGLTDGNSQSQSIKKSKYPTLEPKLSHPLWKLTKHGVVTHRKSERKHYGFESDSLDTPTQEFIQEHMKEYKYSMSSQCKVQLVRSMSAWSGAVFTETSVLNAYLHFIRQSKHLIYIENQFFISLLRRSNKANVIGQAIYTRLKQAIRAKERFRVVVLLPGYSGSGSWKDNSYVRFMMKWQYDTISRGGNSILEKLKKKFPHVDLQKYIYFFCLRTHGKLDNTYVTEQIYVHSKLLIVDDRVVLIGSANINNRSMVGDRDSEISMVVEGDEKVTINMNGSPFQASKFAHNLRVHLWLGHLGLLNEIQMPENKENFVKFRNALYDYSLAKIVEDPVSDATYNLLREVAQRNTAIYDTLFDDIPKNAIKKTPRHKGPTELVGPHGSITESQASRGQKELAKVKGHLTEWPLLFLEHEALSPPLTDIANWIPKNIFK